MIKLKCGDIVELYGDDNYRHHLTDEFDIDTKTNSFVCDEDDVYTPLDCISKVWREDNNGNYILIYSKG